MVEIPSWRLDLVGLNVYLDAIDYEWKYCANQQPSISRYVQARLVKSCPRITLPSVNGTTSSTPHTTLPRSVPTFMISNSAYTATKSSTSSEKLYAPGTTASSNTRATGSSTGVVVAVPTEKSFTGQALLASTCLTAKWTAFPMPSNVVLEIPLVGCANDRLDCCPSLLSSATAESTGEKQDFDVMSALAATSFEVCPEGYDKNAGSCCPR